MTPTTMNTLRSFRPMAPRRSADTGLSRSFLTNLVLKTSCRLVISLIARSSASRSNLPSNLSASGML